MLNNQSPRYNNQGMTNNQITITNWKLFVSCLLVIGVCFGQVLFDTPAAEAATKRTVKKIKRKSRRFYYRKRVPFKAYQEYFISPAIKDLDEPVIEESLKDKGVGTVKFDRADNSIILQFLASKVTALDLILALKNLGYTVTRIN